MTDAVAWMDGQGNLYRYPDDADRGQTMRPLYLEKPTYPNLEEILNRAGFYRRREWEGLTDDFYYIEGSREAERISIPPTTEPFKPDYNTEAVLVEEMQRMAKRAEDLEAMLESQTARIVDLKTHIENLEGEE